MAGVFMSGIDSPDDGALTKVQWQSLLARQLRINTYLELGYESMHYRKIVTPSPDQQDIKLRKICILGRL